MPGGDNRLCERTTGKLAGAVPVFFPATGCCHSRPPPPSPPASSPPATPGPPPKFSKPAACGRTGPFCQRRPRRAGVPARWSQKTASAAPSSGEIPSGRDHRAAEHGGMHQFPHFHGHAGHRDDLNGADDGGGAWQAPPWATSRARTAIMRSTVITVNLRQPDLMLDDDDNRRRGRDRRDGICRYATDMQHSAGKRAAARVRSCRRRPCPRRGWPPRINPSHGSWHSGLMWEGGSSRSH